jgi:hypothetical protein
MCNSLIVFGDVLNKSISYILTGYRVFIIPSNCQCHVVKGIGIYQLSVVNGLLGRFFSLAEDVCNPIKHNKPHDPIVL